MNRRQRLQQAALALSLLVALARCGAAPATPQADAPTALAPTAAPTALPPTSTATAIPPTATPTAPPPTATAIPPTATPTPLPSLDALARQYDEQIGPLAQSLRAARAAGPNTQLPPAADWQIRLVPLSARLFAAQALLYPEWLPPADAAPGNVYILYSYTRGKDLARDFNLFYADTQEVVADIRLLVPAKGGFALIEKKAGVGGAGSSADYKDLVRRAVEPLDGLAAQSADLESIIETIIGYASGLDWRPVGDPAPRMLLLRRALESQYWADRKQAAAALGGLGPDAADAVPDLVAALDDTMYQVRDAAGTGLGAIGPAAAAAVPPLITLLKQREVEMRLIAAEALGKIGAPAKAAEPLLIKALGDDDAALRTKAAEALGGIGADPAVAVPALIPLLDDPEWFVGAAAAKGLEQIGPPAKAAVPALINALKAEGDERIALRFGASQALAAITGQALGDDPARWQTWWESQP